MGQCLLNLLTLEPEKVATGFFFFFLAQPRPDRSKNL